MVSPINERTVKRFYDEFRDAELNKEYYSERMSLVRKKIKYLNIFLALFAGSSAVLGFSLWHYTIYGIPIGGLLLGAITGVAVSLSIAKPYIGLEAEIERLSSIQGVYSVLASLHKDVVDEIMTKHDISLKEDISFDLMRRMRISVDPKEDRPPNRLLIDKVAGVVNRRYPPGFFWYPPEIKNTPNGG